MNLITYRHNCVKIIKGQNGPHSPTVLKKFLLKTHIRSFHLDSDIHQCFLILELFLGKNRIYTQRRAQKYERKNTSWIWHRLFISTSLKNKLRRYWRMRANITTTNATEPRNEAMTRPAFINEGYIYICIFKLWQKLKNDKNENGRASCRERVSARD